MKIGQDSWAERIAQANSALRQEQQDILSELQHLKSDCNDPVQMARIMILEDRAKKHLERLS